MNMSDADFVLSLARLGCCCHRVVRGQEGRTPDVAEPGSLPIHLLDLVRSRWFSPVRQSAGAESTK